MFDWYEINGDKPDNDTSYFVDDHNQYTNACDNHTYSKADIDDDDDNNGHGDNVNNVWKQYRETISHIEKNNGVSKGVDGLLYYHQRDHYTQFN